jgi:5-oxoprolinase (ATP-hydrolysing)
MQRNGWHFCIDRGGTFTDVVARDPAGETHVHKLLSENPEHYNDAPLQAIRDLLGVDAGDTIPAGQIASVKMGTTLATNALLERKGARVGSLVTKGFRDLLAIGYQDRPDLFALKIEKPASLATAIEEIGERVLADGSVRKPIDEEEVRAALQRFADSGIESLAVLFLHSYKRPEHERIVGKLARDFPFAHVSLSHEVANEIKAVPRGDTTMVDAYLTPIIREYVARVREELGPDVPLRFMQSSGGLVDAGRFSGKDAILSGPAGGAIAVQAVAGHLSPTIGFDMGGTSTDVCRVHEFGADRVYETRIAGVRLKAPMIDIHTVAAGGGSVLKFEQGRFTVGPESAGANPGPACYRRGGPATVTDANLVLGRIQPEHFPNTFGPGADQPLDPDASRAAIAALAEAATRATGQPFTIEQAAAGFVRIANENMAKPIKTISVGRGFDLRDHTLVCFGGAGAQHACAMASTLGVKQVLIHQYASVMSAYGFGCATLEHEAVQPCLRPFDDETLSALEDSFREMGEEGRQYLESEGVDRSDVVTTRFLDLRYEGTDTCLTLSAGLHEHVSEGAAPSPLTPAAFHAQHKSRFGYSEPDRSIEVVNMRTQSVVKDSDAVDDEARVETSDSDTKHSNKRFDSSGAAGSAPVWFDGTQVDTPLYRLDALPPFSTADGPCLILSDTTGIVVETGWRVTVNGECGVLLNKVSEEVTPVAVTQRDPITLEIFNNLFMSVAEQMGRQLEQSAHSVNIKERLDFSCAVFTPDGDLVANAPHMPVHLGAMGESVKAVLRTAGDAMRAGDVFVTNDPYNGGSHLPDLTVVSPVIGADGRRTFLVANRGHHADIGGITPGSMPPFSKTLDEEGVVISCVKVVSGGTFLSDELIHLLEQSKYPARNVQERLSDLRAQIAANHHGERQLRRLCDEYGLETVQAYMDHVRDNAAESMREVLGELPDGEYRFEDTLDCGAKIACSIAIRGERAVVDFAGTDPQLDSNLNAPRAVTIAAVLYVFRTLIGKPIPLNSGCLEPIEIRIPEGSLLDPQYPAAVVGGNVETSMRIVDVLYGALGAVAAGQGTMNNFNFGNESFGYYETICGGSGAGPGFNGADAVHQHMTNTRITDPEVLEHRYPVVLHEFSIRPGSGGAGQWHGGNGATRRIEFLESMHASLLAERRKTQPFGLEGGEPGAAGEQWIERNGQRERLDGHATVEARPGDVITIYTPGGGGFGAPGRR